MSCSKNSMSLTCNMRLHPLTQYPSSTFLLPQFLKAFDSNVVQNCQLRSACPKKNKLEYLLNHDSNLIRFLNESQGRAIDCGNDDVYICILNIW